MTDERILAIDIGGGTQDILLYDPRDALENAIKLVLPSPTRIAALRIRRATAVGRPVFLSGRVMGGGAVGSAVRGHLKAGLAVYSLEDPALTLHDNLDKVRGMGVRIVDRSPDGQAVEIVLGDLDLTALRQALALFEVDMPSQAALAIQDHGFSPGFSNRLTRFRQWQSFLDAGGDISGLLYAEPPASLTRWVAAADASPGAWLMDTGGAALRGAMLDDVASEHLEKGLVIVNAGNEHTVAFLIKGRRVYGVFEHHTGLLTPETLADQVDRFTRCALSHEEVFAAMGHGVAYQPGAADLAPWGPMVITGPRREIARGLGTMAAPFGEMMLSGCFGLIEAVRERLTLD